MKKKPKLIKAWTATWGLHEHQWVIGAIIDNYAYLLCQCMEVRKSEIKDRITEEDLKGGDING